MSLSELCTYLDFPPPAAPALPNFAAPIGRKPRPPTLQISEAPPPPPTPKPHPLFHRPRAPPAVQPAAAVGQAGRRQRRPKIWDLLPTPKAAEDGGSSFRSQQTPGFSRRPSYRPVATYTLHVRNGPLSGNLSGLPEESSLTSSASSAKPWDGITSPRSGVHAIGVPRVVESRPVTLRGAEVRILNKVNGVNAAHAVNVVNAVQGAIPHGAFWRNNQRKGPGGVSLASKVASSGAAISGATSSGVSVQQGEIERPCEVHREQPPAYIEASHNEPEARKWTVTPQEHLQFEAEDISCGNPVSPMTDGPASSETEYYTDEDEEQPRKGLAECIASGARISGSRGGVGSRSRAHREALACAADLTELLTALLSVFSAEAADFSTKVTSSGGPAKSSWFWRLISDEADEQQREGEGVSGPIRFGSPAGVLEYLGLTDDEDEEEEDF